MTDNVIVDKIFSFAVGVTKFCFEIQDHRREYVLSHQLFKSGTTLGANVEESQGTISKAEFTRKFRFLIKGQKRPGIGFAFLKMQKFFKMHNQKISQRLQRTYCDSFIRILIVFNGRMELAPSADGFHPCLSRIFGMLVSSILKSSKEGK